MNKIFKHKRGASGLKVVCEFAKSHCSSTEKTAVNSGAHVSTRSGFKSLSIALISALTLGIATPAMAVSNGTGGTKDGEYAYVKGSEAEGLNALAIGINAKAKGEKNTAYGSDAMAVGGGWNLAIGSNAKATADSKDKKGNAIAIGSNTNSTGPKATAIGSDASSTSEQTTAVGASAEATKTQGTAIGSRTKAVGAQSTAIGNDVVATGLSSIAIGNDDIWNDGAIDSEGKLLGYERQVLTDKELKDPKIVKALDEMCEKVDCPKSFGLEKKDDHYEKVGDKFKHWSPTLSGGLGSIAMGSRSVAIGKGSTAIGTLTVATGDESTAIGTLSKATASKAIAIGRDSIANMENSVALGVGSRTDYDGMDTKPYVPSLGYTMPMAKSTGVISVGSANQQRRIVNLAPGALDTDAVNVAQLKSLAESLGMDGINDSKDKMMRYLSIEKATGDAAKLQAPLAKEKAFKTYAELRKIKDMMALNEKATGGTYDKSEKDKINKQITTLEEKYDDFKAKIATLDLSSITTSSSEDEVKKLTDTINKYTNNNPFALNKDQKDALKNANATNEGATGADAIAIGYGASSTENQAVSLGKKATATGTDAIAIGNGANATIASGVALGSNSVADRPSILNKKKDAKDVYNRSDTYVANTIKGNYGAVSVGDSKGTRQITNVAPGSEDSDAVNVAQLKSIGFNVKGKNSDSKTDMTNLIKSDKTVEFASNSKYLKISHEANNGDSKFTFGIDEEELKKAIGTTSGGTAGTGAVTKKYVDDKVKEVDDALDGFIKSVRDGETVYFVAKADKSEAQVKNTTTIEFAGDGNVKTSITQDKDGKTTVNFALNETDLKIGKNGKDGKDGKITVSGKDGSSVEIKGEDGSITAKNKDGKNKVAINGKDGTIGLTKDGTNTTITLSKDGKPDVNGADSTTMPRLTYTTPTNKHEIATLDDGLKFAGNNGDKALKLNKQFTIQGAEKNKDTGTATAIWDTFDKGANIMTKAEADGTNGKLTIALAKALKGLTSAEFKNTAGDTTVINGDGIKYTSKDNTKTVSLGKDGINAGGNKITNIADGEKDGDAVNKKQAETIADNAVKTLTDNITNGTKVYFNAESDDTATGSKKVANTKNIKFEGDGNVKTSIEQTADESKTTVKFTLNTKDLNLGGKDGTDGKIAVNGKDGKSGVAINGKDGTIGAKGEDGKDGVTINGKDHTIIAHGKDGKDGVTINGKDGSITINNGKDGTDGANAKITVANGPAGVDGKSITRIVYTDKDGKNKHEVATLDDGIKLAGNEDTKGSVKLNQTLSIVGNSQTKNDWNDFDQGENIMTKVEGSKTTIALAKSLTKLESAEFINPNDNKKYAKIDEKGLHLFDDGKSSIDINRDGIKLSNKKISGLAEGTESNDAVNKGQLDQEITKLTNDIKNGANFYFNAEADENIAKTVKNTTTIKFEGDNNVKTSITQDATSGKTTVKFALNETNLQIGKNGKDGKDGKITVAGKENSVTIEGKDGLITAHGKDGENGKGVVINGKDGTIGAKGADGKDGVVIDGDKHTIIAKGADGKDGVAINGKDGSIGLTKDGTNTTITLNKDGKPDVNGADKDKMPRLTYTTQNGTKTLATLDDGLKFAGNTKNTQIKRKLNETLTIQGGKENDTETSAENIWVETDAKNNALTIKMAKALKGLTSAEFKNTAGDTTVINGDGIKYTSKDNTKTVSLGKDGINAGGNKITNIADGKDDGDAVNKKQMDDTIKNEIAKNNTNTALTFAGDVSETKAQNGKINIVGGQKEESKLSNNPNIGVVAKDGKLDIKLAKDIDVNSVKANKITAGGVTIEKGKISGVTSAVDPNGKLADKLKAIDNVAGKTAAKKAAEKKAAIQEALKNADNGNVATVGDLKNVTNGLDSVVENVTNITNITNMVANSNDKKEIDEAAKVSEKYQKATNDKEKQKIAKEARKVVEANKIKTYNPYKTTVKNNTTIVEAIQNMNERGIKFIHVSEKDNLGEDDNFVFDSKDSRANKIGSIGIGMNAASTAENAIATGTKSEASGADAIATGTNSIASGKNSIAMGKDAQAMGENTISIGTGNKVIGRNSGAIGDPTTLKNVNGVYAMGNDNFIQGGGKDVDKTARDIFAIGNNIGSDTKKVTDKANGSVILGSKGYSNVENGVALGYGSNASVKKGEVGYDITKTDHSSDTSGVWKSTENAVSVGDVGNIEKKITRQITSVAAGTQDTDAVNVAQLKAVAHQITAVTTNGMVTSNQTFDPKTGKQVSYNSNYAPKVTGTGVNSVAIGANSVANRANTVSVGSAGNERIIANVADGVAPTDAANMRQLQSVANMIGEVKKDAMAGTASAMAIGNLPQATIPGKGMMAIGAGYYKGQTATALGVSKMSENGRWVFKASASYDSQRNVGAAGAVGFHF